jgi:hypothetical protein
VKWINEKYPVTLLSLGDEIFFDRLAQPFQFEMGRTTKKLHSTISLLQRVNVGNWIGRVIVAAQGHYPIYPSLRRKEIFMPSC